MDNIGIQFVYTGTPVGNFNAQVSADYVEDNNRNVINPGNWINIEFDSQPAAAAAADNIYLDINQISSPWIRYTYTSSSGTGTLSAFIVGKEV